MSTELYVIRCNCSKHPIIGEVNGYGRYWCRNCKCFTNVHITSSKRETPREDLESLTDDVTQSKAESQSLTKNERQ